MKMGWPNTDKDFQRQKKARAKTRKQLRKDSKANYKAIFSAKQGIAMKLEFATAKDFEKQRQEVAEGRRSLKKGIEEELRKNKMRIKNMDGSQKIVFGSKQCALKMQKD